MKTQFKHIILTSLLLCAIGGLSVNAQWQQTSGPYGGNINGLAVSGNKIFAGADCGVFVSTDNGVSWLPTTFGLNSVVAIAAKGNNIVVATDGFFSGAPAVFLSADGGVSWSEVVVDANPGFPGVTSLISDGIAFYSGSEWGAYVSVGGGFWTQMGASQSYIYSLCIGGNTLFAGTALGVYKATGALWTLTSLPSLTSMTTLGSDIFAGTEGNGVFLSTDTGATWTAVNTGLADTLIKSLTVLGSNIFAGTFYYNTGSGIFLSSNNGASWTPVNTGLTDTGILSLATIGGNVIAGTYNGGVFLSANSGASWRASGVACASVQSLAVSGNNIFAGTYSNGISLSADGGASWTAINTGLTDRNVTTITISGSNVFAGTYNGGVFLSTDTGVSWTAVNTGLTARFGQILSLAAKGVNIFAGTYDGVFLSTNNGTSWSPVNNGLLDSNDSIVTSFAINGNNIFAGTWGGVFLSTDNGASWTAKGFRDTLVYSLAINGNNIIAGTGVGIFSSIDNGANWSPSSGSPYWAVQSFAFYGNNIFAGINGSGVYLSTDNGASWSPVNTGLTDTFVTQLIIKGTEIFTGTYPGGVWKRPLIELVGPCGGFGLSTSATPSAFCQNNGTATASPFGGTPPYTYMWFTGSYDTTATIYNVGQGCYSVTVTDAHGCSFTTCAPVGVKGAAFDLSVSVANGSAAAVVTVNGGAGQFVYSWSNGGNDSTISNLTSGTYYITVTDTIGGCVRTDSVVITAPSGIGDLYSVPVISISPNPAYNDLLISNNGHLADAMISIYNLLGEKMLEEKVNLGSRTSISIMSLPPGIYFVRVSDGQMQHTQKLVVQQTK